MAETFPERLARRYRRDTERIETALSSRDRRAFHALARDRNRVVAKLAEIALRELMAALVRGEPYCECGGTDRCGGGM